MNRFWQSLGPSLYQGSSVMSKLKSLIKTQLCLIFPTHFHRLWTFLSQILSLAWTTKQTRKWYSWNGFILSQSNSYTCNQNFTDSRKFKIPEWQQWQKHHLKNNRLHVLWNIRMIIPTCSLCQTQANFRRVCLSKMSRFNETKKNLW